MTDVRLIAVDFITEKLVGPATAKLSAMLPKVATWQSKSRAPKKL
jgi:hypothetical protein